MTIADCLLRASELESVSDTARLDVEVLLSRVLNKPRVYLYTWPDRSLDESELAQFSDLLARRGSGEPVAYLLGEKEFWSLVLKVNTSTLIPRPETETLIEVALEKLPADACKVLDLGTGTGAIALALASERPAWTLVAVDSNPAAVQLAIENARRHGLKNVHITRSNWFENVGGERFDMIVSNPPYLDASDPHLGQGDVRFEPPSALIADKHGLADLEQIIDSSRLYLRSGGWLLVEHGCEQGESVRRLFSECAYGRVHTRPDLAGLDRITLGQQENLYE